MDVLNIKNENIITTGDVKLYLCDVCNECYSQERSFKLHYRAHRSFPCEVCKKVFTLKRDLTVHRRTHSSTKKKYVCDVCQVMFPNKNKMQIHLRSHGATSNFCGSCKINFPNKAELKKHFKAHSAEDTFVCNICLTTFFSKAEYKKHCGTHSTKNAYICNICNESFLLKTKLRNHSCGHTVQKTYSCSAIYDYHKQPKQEICEEVFESKTLPVNDTLNQMSEKLHGSVVSKKNERLESKSSDIKNEKSHDVSIKEEGCELPSSSSSARHRPYICELCKTGFSRKSSLMSHKCIKKEKGITKV